MNLYYTLTLYHLLCACLHKMKMNQGDSHLIISDLTVNADKIKEELEKQNIFTKVYIFEDKKILNGRKKYKNYDDREYKNIISDNARLVKNILPISVEDYNNIYIAADHFPFGLYLNYHNIQYDYFEDGNGQHSKREQTINAAIKEKDPYLYCISRHICLFGESSNVKKRYIDYNAQEKSYKIQENDLDFNVLKLFDTLSIADKAKLKTIFGVFNFKLDFSSEESVLILPQHNVNLGVFSVREQLYQLGLLIDYFANNYKIVIKPHPNDCYTNYTLLADIIIPSNFPSELLLLVGDGKKFGRGITAWSTSIKLLSPILNEIVEFDYNIDEKYKSIHSYYVSLKMLQKLLEYKKNIFKVYTLGVYLPLINNLLNYMAEFIDLTCQLERLEDIDEYYDLENVVLIVDDMNNNDLQKISIIMKKTGNIVIFINTKQDYRFFKHDYSIFKNMLLWTITKKNSMNNSLYDVVEEREEGVWLYMEDEKVLEIISDVFFKKEMKKSGDTIYINMPRDNYEGIDQFEIYRKIKKMEGILKASERRALNEIEKNKKLIEIIRKHNINIEKNDDEGE